MEAINVDRTFRRRIKRHNRPPAFWIEYRHEGDTVQRTFPEMLFYAMQIEY